MKVRVAFTVDIDREGRELVAGFYGLDGLADREWIGRFFRRHGESGWLVLGDEATIGDEEA